MDVFFSIRFACIFNFFFSLRFARADNFFSALGGAAATTLLTFSRLFSPCEPFVSEVSKAVWTDLSPGPYVLMRSISSLAVLQPLSQSHGDFILSMGFFFAVLFCCFSVFDSPLASDPAVVEEGCLLPSPLSLLSGCCS